MFVFTVICAVLRIQIWGYKLYVRFPLDFRSISHTNLRLQTLCSCFLRFMQYFAHKSEVTKPMFVFRAISAVFRIQIRGYKPYVRFQCDFSIISNTNLRLQTLCSFSVRFLQSFAYKADVTNPMFVFTTISAVFRIQIWGYKPYVHFQCGFHSISHTNMFVFRAISVVFRIQNWGYKPYVHFQWGFRSISHTNPRLQTLCLFSVQFLQYFEYKSEVTNPMFVFRAISAVVRI